MNKERIKRFEIMCYITVILLIIGTIIYLLVIKEQEEKKDEIKYPTYNETLNNLEKSMNNLLEFSKKWENKTINYERNQRIKKILKITIYTSIIGTFIGTIILIKNERKKNE